MRCSGRGSTAFILEGHTEARPCDPYLNAFFAHSKAQSSSSIIPSHLLVHQSTQQAI